MIRWATLVAHWPGEEQKRNRRSERLFFSERFCDATPRDVRRPRGAQQAGTPGHELATRRGALRLVVPMSRLANLAAVLLGVVGIAVGIAPSATAVTDPGYVLYTNADGSIARWNPCQVIHYRVNDATGGPGALADVFSAVSQVESSSGLQMVYDGPSTEIPQSDYAATTDPSKPAPLLIAWASPSQSNALSAGSELGYSGTTVNSWTGSDGAFHPTQIVSGYTVFTNTANLAGGFGPASYATRGRLLLHELGHIAGLMHTTDPNEVMYPVIDGRAGTYAAGDRAGLARVGASAGCIGASTPLAAAAASTPLAAAGSAPAAPPATPHADPWTLWWAWLVDLLQSWFY